MLTTGSLTDPAWLAKMEAERWRRLELLEQAEYDTSLQGLIRAGCKIEHRLYFQLFAWGFDTRESPPEVPILQFDRQWEIIEAYLGLRYTQVPGVPCRLLIEKSRDFGVTSTLADCATYVWTCQRGRHQGMTSRTRDDVDDRTDLSLFGTIRWKIRALPWWMRPKSWRREEPTRKVDKLMALVNDENGNVILGAASTVDIFRGKRFWNGCVDEAAMLDEKLGIGALAKVRKALSQTSRSMVYLSTPGSDEFAAMCSGRSVSVVDSDSWTPDSAAGFVKIRCHYSEDPRKGETWLAEMERQYAQDPEARDIELECIHASQRAPGRVWPEYVQTRHQLTDSQFDRVVAPNLPSAILSEGWDYGPSTHATARVVLAYWPPLMTEDGHLQLDGDGRPVRNEFAVAIEGVTFESPHPIEIADHLAQPSRVAPRGWATKANPGGLAPHTRRGDWLIHQYSTDQYSWARSMRVYAGIEVLSLRKDVIESHSSMRRAWGIRGAKPTLYLAPWCAELATSAAAFRWRHSIAASAKAQVARSPHSHICDALTVAYLGARLYCGVHEAAILLAQHGSDQM